MYQVRISSIYWATLSDSQLSTVNSGLWTLDSGLSGLRTLWTLDSLDSLHSLDSLDSRLSTLDSRLSHLTSRLSTLDSRLSTLASRLATLATLAPRCSSLVHFFVSFVRYHAHFSTLENCIRQSLHFGWYPNLPSMGFRSFPSVPSSHLPILGRRPIVPLLHATRDVRRATCDVLPPPSFMLHSSHASPSLPSYAIPLPKSTLLFLSLI